MKKSSNHEKKPCPYCSVMISKTNLSTHIKRSHQHHAITHHCHFCKTFHSDKDKLSKHIKTCAQGKKYENNANAVSRKEIFYNDQKSNEDLVKEGWILETFCDLKITGLNFENANVANAFSEENFGLIEQTIENKVQNYNKIKMILTYKCEFYIYEDEVNETLKLRHFDLDSDSYTVNNKSELKGALENAMEAIDVRIQEVLKSSSKLILKRIHGVIAHLTAFSSNSGHLSNQFLEKAGSYIKISHLMPSKKGILNIQNFDNKCMIWCILAHFLKINKNEHNYRVEKYLPYEYLVKLPHSIDLDNVTENNLQWIEKSNNIKINIITLKDEMNSLLRRGIKKDIHRARENSRNINLSSGDINDYVEDEDDDYIILANRDIDEEDDQENNLLNEVSMQLANGEYDGVDRTLLDPRYANDLFYPYRVSKHIINPDPNAGLTFKYCNQGLPFGHNLDESNREINLLLVKEENNAHLILIHDIKKFFHRQLVCTNCFQFRCDQRYPHKLEIHKELCLSNEACKIILPDVTKNEHLVRFKNIKNCHKADSYLVADFETTVYKLSPEEQHNTKKVSQLVHQIPNSFALYYKSHENVQNYFSLEHNHDKDNLILTLIYQIKYYAVCAFNAALRAAEHKFDWTSIKPDQAEDYRSAKKCKICLMEFIDISTYCEDLNELEEADRDYVIQRQKILHHDHHTGEYIATVCTACNHKMKDRKLLPVLFHNGRGFDWHLFVKQIAKDPDMYIKIIPQSGEKFNSFSTFMKIKTGNFINKMKWDKLLDKKVPVLDEFGNNVKIPKYELMEIRFVDSMSFFNNASLSTLVDSLRLKSGDEFKLYGLLKEDFNHTYRRFKSSFPDYPDYYFWILLQKGIYPYHYISDYSKLYESNLPPIEFFKSELTSRDKSLETLSEELWKMFVWNIVVPKLNDPHNFFSLSFIDVKNFESMFNLPKKLITYKDSGDFRSLSLDEFKVVFIEKMEKNQLKLTDQSTEMEKKQAYQTLIEKLDYSHAHRVYKLFQCKTIKDYHDIYLTWDVLLLTDIFENFRKEAWSTFGLECLYYYGVPGLAYDAMLKTNLVHRAENNLPHIETLTDLDMILMCEKAQRGGVSHASHRYSCAIPKNNFNPKNTFIQYWDATNLYGWAMCQELPAYDYQWVDDGYIERMNDHLSVGNYYDLHFLNPPGYGKILEVDLELPDKYHDYYSDYPLAPENRKVRKEDLSEYQRKFNYSLESPKLLCTLDPKSHYVCYMDNLLYMIDQGYVLKKVHRAFSFKKEAWLKPYVDLMTVQRNAASSEFVKNLKKLYVNSVYGKLNENLRKHFGLEMVSSPHDAKKIINKFNYSGNFTIYDDNLVGIKMNQLNIKFTKPLSCAIVILELSKLLMQKFVYDCCKPFFDPVMENTGLNQNFKVLYTDTDSIVAEIRMEGNIYRDFILQESGYFDYSVYSDDHEIFDGMEYDQIHHYQKRNKKVLGYMKDEMGNKKIIEWVALKSKSYAYKVLDKIHGMGEGSRCKGISSSLFFDQYLHVLVNPDETISVTENKMRSNKHEIFINQQSKKALSAYDDKRFLFEGKASTLALGHYRTKS